MINSKDFNNYNYFVEEYTLKYKVPPVKSKRMIIQVILGFILSLAFLMIIIFQLVFNNGFKADSGTYYEEFSGTRIIIYIIVGLFLGYILHRTFFGFSNTFLRGVRSSQYNLAKNLVLLLMISTIIFSFVNLIMNGSTPSSSAETIAFNTKISLGFIIGAILFGIGMNLAGSTPFGILKSVGDGGGKGIIILFSIAIGSTLGLVFVYPLMGADPTIIDSGYKFLGKGDTANFWVAWGVIKGMIVNLIILAVIYFLLFFLEQRKNKKCGIIATAKIDREREYLLNRPAYITNETCSRMYFFLFKRKMSTSIGAAAIAIITITMYIVFDGNFGFTTTFGMWGLYATNWFVDPSTITVVGYPISLSASEMDMVSSGLNGFWHDPYSWLNISVICGAIVSSLLQTKLTFKFKNVNAKVFWFCFIGGLMLGFGAAIGSGGNISNLYEATATGSLSGYIWIIILFLTSLAFVTFTKHHQHLA